MTHHADMPDETEPGLPVLLVVDANPATRSQTEVALTRRFGTDYRVLAADTATTGLAVLERLAHQAAEVALVAVDLQLPGMDGIEFLHQAHALHPSASRALLVAMDPRGTRIPFGSLASLQRATALGRIDFWVLKGSTSPEELLYPHVQEALSAWTRANRPRHEVVRVIGDQWAPKSHALRDALGRNTVPFRFYAADSEEGRQALAEHEVDASELPVVLFQDGLVLPDPTLDDVADALGVNTRPSSEIYDLAILGAGPSGLTAAVYGASEGLRTLVVEPQAIGGQAGMSSMIRNYPGFPRGVSGGELAFRAWEQSLLFGAEFLFMHQANGLTIRGDRFGIALDAGSEAFARTVIVATGVSYRRLWISALEHLTGVGVFYGAAAVEAPGLAGEEVFVIGGANSAGQAALHLAKFAARVTMLVRGESLTTSMSDYLITQIQANDKLEVRTGTRVVDGHGQDRLEALTVEEIGTGRREQVPAAAVFVMIGAEARTDWLPETIQRDRHGFIRTGTDLISDGSSLARPPLPFETSLPGVFAVGDVRHGSVKRVAGAVGEGSVSVGSVHRYLAETMAAGAGRS